MTHRNESTNVIFRSVKGNARHRHTLRALGERDVEQPMRKHRIAIKHLVEVAHAKEEQAVGVRILEARVLPHRRRVEVRIERRVDPSKVVWISAGGRNGHAAKISHPVARAIVSACKAATPKKHKRPSRQAFAFYKWSG